MFQSFTSHKPTSSAADRIKALRDEMHREDINWYLVPHADEHQNEYLPEFAERLSWLTGFDGSAGFAIIGLEQAHIFVDGRYTLQVRDQVELEIFTPQDLINNPPHEFLKTLTKTGDIIGFDPWLITLGQMSKWQNAAEDTETTLKPFENLVDRIWMDQPQQPIGKAWLHPKRYAGKSTANKLVEIREILKTDKVDYLFLTDPASLAWTFNLRGSDVIHNPLALGYAIIPAHTEKPLIFIDKRKLDEENGKQLEQISNLFPPSTLEKELTKLAKQNSFHIDPALVSTALNNLITDNGGKIIKKRDPVVLLRAVKNETELSGTREAHIRDGVAMVSFLSWLDKQTPGTIDEIGAAKKLEEIRAQSAVKMGSKLQEIAFDTISGAGSNGAIPHYRVNEDTNKVIEDNSLYLCDSGGQYLDGTTDITRTVCIGKSPNGSTADFTLVLKGHIAMAKIRFPEGTRGVDLDILARMPLWQHGKDYAHGTGHGVGSYLNVHEGPQSLSKRGMEKLLPSMILSNEPGYYKQGEYGIRIENLVIVSEAKDINSGDQKMLEFETITLCPIDLRLVDSNMLTSTEREWLNNYHQRVRETLDQYMADEDKTWLNEATKPV